MSLSILFALPSGPSFRHLLLGEILATSINRRKKPPIATISAARGGGEGGRSTTGGTNPQEKLGDGCYPKKEEGPSGSPAAGGPPSTFGRPYRPGRPYSQKMVYASPLFARFGAYQGEYHLRTFSIPRCWNDVTILWRQIYLRRWVQFFLDERGPFLYFDARNFWEWTALAGCSFDVDPGAKLRYITLRYDTFSILPLYN